MQACEYCHSSKQLRVDCDKCEQLLYCSKLCRNRDHKDHAAICGVIPRCRYCYNPEVDSTFCPDCRKWTFCSECAVVHSANHKLVCGTVGITMKEERTLLLTIAKTKINDIPINEYMAQQKLIAWLDVDVVTSVVTVRTEEVEIAERYLHCWSLLQKHRQCKSRRVYAYRILKNGVLEFELPVITTV
jgi:hypothetical protein